MNSGESTPCIHVQIHAASSNKPAHHSPTLVQHTRHYKGLDLLLLPLLLRQVTAAGGMTKFIDSGAAKLRIEEAATKKQVGCLIRKISAQLSQVAK